MYFSTSIQIILGLLCLKTFAELYLEYLNRGHTRANGKKPPQALEGIMSAASYKKSVEYTLAKSYFRIIELIFNALLLSAIFVSGILSTTFYLLFDLLGTSIWGQAASYMIIMSLISLIGLPLDWWSQFKLEAKFGFNKSTQNLWVMDKLKGLLLSFALGTLLVAFIVFCFAQVPEAWVSDGRLALALTVSVVAFQLFILILYPYCILPLFNKLTPLEDGSLKKHLLKVAKDAHFPAHSILVMDGSKRSTHSNAFFTGFGAFRKIVLFDTLIEQLTIKELGAVLAHEIGHYKKGHVLKNILLSSVILGLAFWAITYCSQTLWFFTHFQFSPPSGIVPILLVFTLSMGIITYWIGPIFNLLSRKFEYEADAFAKHAVGSAAPLSGGLRKLHDKNLSNLTPHPAYSFVHYSHPTLLERERALDEA